MARRDPSLDSRITAAAFEEFSEKGYAGASLRKIAEKAGATVGAIQIRYKSKDELFVSLLKPFLSEIEAAFQSIRSDYYSGADEWIPARLRASIQRESAVILHLIFNHYDEAVLLLYQSAGSSLESFFDTLVARKIEESFDLVTAFETVYFWPGLPECFGEVSRVLKPGGTFFICNECDGNNAKDDKWTKIIDGMTIYNAGELKAFLEQAGFHGVQTHKNGRGWLCVTAQK